MPEAASVRAFKKVLELSEEGVVNKLCETISGVEDNLFILLDRAVRDRDVDQISALSNELDFINRIKVEACKLPRAMEVKA